MSASEDIRNLFGKFEGQTQQYQEVTRDDQAVEARSRWPLLSSVALNETDRVPDVADTSTHAPDFDPLHGGDSSSGSWHARVASEGSTAARSAASSSTPNAASSSLRGALFGARSAQQVEASGAVAEPLRVAPAPASAPTPAPSSSSPSSASSSGFSSGLSSYGSAEPTGPTSTFAPPRAPGPRPAPLPFLRDAAPAFQVHTGPAGRASAASASTLSSSSPIDVAPAAAAQAAPLAPVASVTPMAAAPTGAAPIFPATPSASATPSAQSTAARVDSPPPVLRRSTPAASVTPFSTAPALSVQSAAPSEPAPSSVSDSAFPPVVTPETSKRRAFHSRDFAPPVVPVNHYKPSAAPITGVEAELDYGALKASGQPGAIPSGSILGKLFAPAAPAPAYEEAPPAHAGSRDLQSVFGRLAGGAGGGADRGEGA